MDRDFGFPAWEPPDAGENTDPAGFGGGTAGVAKEGFDEDYTRQAERFLAAADLPEPFCLIVSLVNPHDVLGYPSSYAAGGYRREQFADLPIDLPVTVDEDLFCRAYPVRFPAARTAAFHAKRDRCFSSKALLRQPGGFEGRVNLVPAKAENFGSHDLPAADLVRARERSSSRASLPGIRRAATPRPGIVLFAAVVEPGRFFPKPIRQQVSIVFSHRGNFVPATPRARLDSSWVIYVFAFGIC